jgi:hypothetical protein
MVTPVVWPSRHKRLLSLGWPVDGASRQASANYACEYVTLNHFSSTFQSHLCKEGIYMPCSWLCNFWMYSGAFLKHFSITSLQTRTCTCLSFDYAALYLFWSIFGSVLKHFWACLQKRTCASLSFDYETLDLFLRIYNKSNVALSIARHVHNLCRNVIEKCLRNALE